MKLNRLWKAGWYKIFEWPSDCKACTYTKSFTPWSELTLNAGWRESKGVWIPQNCTERHYGVCIMFYKITKIVRVLWLVERSVCMRVCKHGCGVKMFCFSCANHAGRNLTKFLSSKLDKFTLFTHSFVGWNLENGYKESVRFFSLKLTF